MGCKAGPVSFPPCPCLHHVFPKGLALGVSDTRSKVHTVNGESTSANDQEIQNLLFEEIWNTFDPLYTSFRKYTSYLDQG
jgi:hypothetical protein